MYSEDGAVVLGTTLVATGAVTHATELLLAAVGLIVGGLLLTRLAKKRG
jgi:hypothetical protein